MYPRLQYYSMFFCIVSGLWNLSLSVIFFFSGELPNISWYSLRFLDEWVRIFVFLYFIWITWISLHLYYLMVMNRLAGTLLPVFSVLILFSIPLGPITGGLCLIYRKKTIGASPCPDTRADRQDLPDSAGPFD